MNLLATFNKDYFFYFQVMLDSFVKHHQDHEINVFVVCNDIEERNLDLIRNNYKNLNVSLIRYQNQILDRAKTTYRFPKEVYARLYAAEYLPEEIDRVLYLDPDTIVLKNLAAFYRMEFDGSYFIGASNVKRFFTAFNNWKNKAKKGSKYLNTGVLLINVEKLRRKQNIEELNDYIIKNENRLFLPDQDVLNALYGTKVSLIEHLKYNLSDRAITRHNLANRKKIDYRWVEKYAYVLHFYGKNKPWNNKYKGILRPFYQFHAKRVESLHKTILSN
ncbi:MAG: glycosyltransferase family 8 protein [Acholeplasmataceae bacterium]|jgi:lipopolysaccharide biosynthesis glycosyltransferase|nr:glycosyltransferase family 8 protein [Acholeplasmataceae bacterium]